MNNTIPPIWAPGFNTEHWAAEHCRQFIPCWNPGERMHDVSGNGNHVQRVNSDGTSARAVAPFGLAAKIETATDYYRPVNDLYLPANGTVVARIKCLDYSEWSGPYASPFGVLETNANRAVVLISRSTGKLLFFHGSGYAGVGGIDWQKWTDIAYVTSPTRGLCYINGELVADITSPLDAASLPYGLWACRSLRYGNVDSICRCQFGYMGLFSRGWTGNQVMRFRDDPWGLCQPPCSPCSR